MLESLRSKPHHIKQSISLVVTSVLFAGILFVWVSSQDARTRKVEVETKTVSPTEGFLSVFDGFWGDLKEKTLKGAFSEREGKATTSTTTFDFNAVVVIDPGVATTSATSTQNASSSRPQVR